MPDPKRTPAPGLWRPTGILALYLLLALIPYLPSLWPGRWAFGTDTVSHDVPVNLYGWQQTGRHGEWPLWSAHLRGGLPAVGSFAFMPYYPPNWLTAAVTLWAPSMDPDERTLGGRRAIGVNVGNYLWAHTLQWPLHHALAAFFMFLFLRRLGRSDGAAFLGGLAFGLAPHVVTLTYPGHLAKVQAIAWMPAPLWLLTRPRSDGFRRDGGSDNDDPSPGRVAGAGLCLAMPILAGHPQIFAYSAGLALAWTFAESASRRSLRPTAGFAGALALGLLLAAPQFLPGIEMLPHSNRAELSYEEATKSSYPPVELFELLVPRHRGDSVRPELGGKGWYRGLWGERLVSDYLGVVALSLALVGLCLGRSRARWFWLAIFLLALIHCLGSYLGLYYLLFLRAVPFAGVFRTPAALMVFLPFALAPLAAEGADRVFHLLSDCPTKERIHSPERLFTILAIPFLVILAILVLADTGVFGGLSEVFRNPPVSKGELLGPYVTTLLMAGVLPMALLILPSGSPDRSRIVASVLLAGFLVFDSGRANVAFVRRAPIEDLLHEALDVPPPPEEFRPSAPALFQPGRELSLWPMLRGWAVPWGYHPIRLARQDYWMTRLGFDSPEFLRASRTLAVRLPAGTLEPWAEKISLIAALGEPGVQVRSTAMESPNTFEALLSSEKSGAGSVGLKLAFPYHPGFTAELSAGSGAGVRAEIEPSMPLAMTARWPDGALAGSELLRARFRFAPGSHRLGVLAAALGLMAVGAAFSRGLNREASPSA